jgi:hypothetical protein
MMDTNSPIGSEGIPYVLDSFTQLDIMENSSILDTGEAWEPKSGAAPILYKLEFVFDNAIVAFP